MLISADRILGVVLQSIGATYGMFLAARFLIGFGVAIAHGASPLLITELVHTQHRAIFTTIYNSTSSSSLRLMSLLRNQSH